MSENNKDTTSFKTDEQCYISALKRSPLKNADMLFDEQVMLFNRLDIKDAFKEYTEQFINADAECAKTKGKLSKGHSHRTIVQVVDKDSILDLKKHLK